MVDDAGRILKKTVDDILDFSKLEADADKFSFHEDEFELNDLVSNTIGISFYYLSLMLSFTLLTYI